MHVGSREKVAYVCQRMRTHGLPCALVLPARPPTCTYLMAQAGQIEKTTSGKVRRFKVRQLYESKALPRVIGSSALADSQLADAANGSANGAPAMVVVPELDVSKLGEMDVAHRREEVESFVCAKASPELGSSQ